MNYKERLLSIQRASGWSQEQLAARLKVTFATLNSWINERSTPRKNAIIHIEELYFEIVGTNDVDEMVLNTAKQALSTYNCNAEKIVNSPEKLAALTLHLTYHTNTIEGSTMTLADVGDVIFENKVLANRTAIEQTEARNHQAALHWLLDELVRKKQDFIIDAELIRSIHLRLMNGIISDAGIYRNHSVRIMGSHVALVNWVKIPDEIHILTTTLKNSQTDLISTLASTHAKFEKIHPFNDGNGRTGRLIMLAQALKAGVLPPLIVKERKHAYYKYLEFAQTIENHKPLELFITQSIEFTAKLLKHA